MTAPSPLPLAVTHVVPFGDYDGQIVFSGAENHLFQLMAGQKAAGLDVELLMLVIQDGPRLKAKADELEAAGITVTRLVYRRDFLPVLGRAAWVGQMPRLASLMRARRQRIIHTHLPHASQLGRIAARTAGCRFIVDSVHNDEPHLAAPSWRARLQALDRITGQTIAITERVKEHLVNGTGLPAEKITVIPYGIEPPGAVDRAAARRSLGLPMDAFVVGFVGRLVPQKDIGVLLEAMRSIPDAHLCIVGAGELDQELRTHAARLALPHLHFAGARPNGADLMAAFDVLALPSKWEGLGLVLLEAMARGVPIAATRAGAIPEVLKGGELGLLSDIGDPAGLAANIGTLMTDEPTRARLASAGRQAVARTYSVEAMVNATTQVYEDVRRARTARTSAEKRVGRVRQALGAAKGIAVMTVGLGRATGRPDVATRFAMRRIAGSIAPVEMGWQGYRLQARSCDWDALNEVLIEDEYGELRSHLEVTPSPVVLDLGANIGTFALFSFSVSPHAAVHSFEPSADTFAVLEGNRARNPQCDWHVQRAAGWGEDGTVSFSASAASTAGRVDAGGSESVPAMSLATILARCGGRIDVAKIDIEGAEEPLICGGAFALQRIETLVVELHPDRCDAARVAATLRESYGRLFRIPGRRSSKPLLLATRSSVRPDLPVYDG
jgi:FkbM family methyltransferase